MLDWSAYDAERARRAGGAAGLDAARRADVEATLVGLLELSPSDATGVWGDAVGYGRDSVAVVRPRDGLSHRYASDRFPVAVKVYRRRSPRLLAWHTDLFRRTPCVSGNPRVQQSVAAGEATDTRGRRRSFAVVQFVPGVLLEGWLAAKAPPPAERAAALLREVFE